MNKNEYFDTDTMNNIIEIVTKRQELRLFHNRSWLIKQYLNSKYGLCCCVRHGKSKRLKELLSSK